MLKDTIIEMFKETPIIGSIVLLILLSIVLISVDAITSSPFKFQGTVIDHQYKAESFSVGTGVMPNSNGNTGVVATTEFTPEEFLLIIKNEQGKIITATCAPELYYDKKEGDKVDFYIHKGSITGLTWATEAIN